MYIYIYIYKKNLEYERSLDIQRSSTMKLYYFQERLILPYKSWSYCLRFIYVSREINNFQNDLFFKDHSYVRRLSILFSITLIIECFKDVFHNIFTKTFLK